MCYKYVLLLLTLLPMQFLIGQSQENVLIYGENVQVNSQVNPYENITAGVPIHGTVMVTHNEKSPVDPTSFRLGSNPLNVKFVQTVPPSPYSPLVIDIYQFELEGMKQGMYTLHPIKVKVGGKEYQAAPMTIQVAQ